MSDTMTHWIGLSSIVLTALLVAWWPGAAIVRRLLDAVNLSDDTGLARPGLGRWIGRFERTLIVLLMIADAPTAVGLVVTAKSILRFPEITGEKPAIRPEYVLVGSMASWAIGVAIGYVATVFIGELPAP